MVDEVQKYNLQLREQNEELNKKYEKEKAKVFQLNFELEKRKRPIVNNIKRMSAISKNNKTPIRKVIKA